jgi:RPA family protein
MNLENQQQPARRVFAEELNNATDSVQADEDRAPVFNLLDTCMKANRVFIIGTLTEVEDVGNDSEYLRARVVGPTGTFYVYAGQYQPEAAAFLNSTDAPAYVSVVAKISTYEKDNGDVNVSLNPEAMNEVSGADRDRWVVETAQRTLARIEAIEGEDGEPLDGSDPSLYDADNLDRHRANAIRALEEVHEEQANAESESGAESAEEANA